MGGSQSTEKDEESHQQKELEKNKSNPDNKKLEAGPDFKAMLIMLQFDAFYLLLNLTLIKFHRRAQATRASATRPTAFVACLLLQIGLHLRYVQIIRHPECEHASSGLTAAMCWG
jgi:heme/copper-type cytochrome/quinol oxidase subunit 4